MPAPRPLNSGPRRECYTAVHPQLFFARRGSVSNNGSCSSSGLNEVDPRKADGICPLSAPPRAYTLDGFFRSRYERCKPQVAPNFF